MVDVADHVAVMSASADDEDAGTEEEEDGTGDEDGNEGNIRADFDNEEDGNDSAVLSPYLKWNVSCEEPEDCIRIEDEALAAALKQKDVFDREEVGQLQLQRHPRNGYIEVDGMYFTPAGPSYDHAVTDEDIACLLQAVDPSHENRPVITTVLKKFGYRKQWLEWLEWSDGICSDDEWWNADTKSGHNLNYIVSLVSGSRIQQNTPTIEKIYFNEPSLSEANLKRVTNHVDMQFLSADLLDTEHRVTAVKSCTGSGKTQATIDLARKKDMLVLSVCCRISQVDEHCKTFKNKLPSATVTYKSLPDFKPGVHNCVTTLDSLHKVESLLSEVAVKGYILFLDEIHSLLDHLIRSPTLKVIRKQVFSSLSRIFKNAGKVVMSDNEIDNRDLDFVDMIRRVHGRSRQPIDFIVNDYKKYTGIEVILTNDKEEQIEYLKREIADGTPFTCPCNTKKCAEEIAMRLRQDFPERKSKINCITSAGGRFDASTVDSEWSDSFVIYSPTISTGIDYNPTTAQNVYLFLHGEHTVSPHTALQMIARNRNIKRVYICSTGMRNMPEWHTRGQMDASFDGLKGNIQSMCIMKDLCNSNFNECTGTFEFSENKFTDLYKKDQWDDNVMRSSYMHNLKRLLQTRGFQVICPSLKKKLEQMQVEYDWKPIKDLVKQEINQKFKQYLENTLPEADFNLEKCLDHRMEALHRTKAELQELIQAHPEHQHRIIEVCTNAQTFQDNRNLELAFYTDDKLRRKYEYSGTCNYDMSRQHTPTAKCLLLREMLAIQNHGMSVQLKPHDLTLRQKDYDENERVEVPDNVWKAYKHYKKNKNHRCLGSESKPETRKQWMMCIYSLAKDLFGDGFVNRMETSKNGLKCYNFLTDRGVVDVAILLLKCGRANLDDFQREIVQKYRLDEAQANPLLCVI